MRKKLFPGLTLQVRVIPVILLALLCCNGCNHSPREKGVARFHWFNYEGSDPFYQDNPLSDNEFYNPILPGFYPDPSICRKGDDFYIVTSTFAWFPGVPVFHSRNLVDWVQVGHILNRPSQLNLDGLQVSQGIFAPAMEYNPHNDTFYMITTLVGQGGNFVVTAKDPAGPWSDPFWLPEVPGIDPSLFFDDDGRAWIVHNAETEGPPLYNGHRALWIREFDVNTNKVAGPGKMIVDGGVDITTQPIWMEAPHLYKINGVYYLMAAEGGTAEHHSEVIFTSHDILGPYIPMEINPILTQRDLPGDRPYPVTSTGHADIVQAPNGEWYAVFLGCRPYKDRFYNTGRETFLLPVTWQQGIPVILPQGEPVPLKLKRPAGLKDLDARNIYPTGNFVQYDDFTRTSLSSVWNSLRTPRDNWYEITNSDLVIQCRTATIRSGENPSFLARRQQHQNFSASIGMTFLPGQPGQKAGLVLFQHENHNYFLGVKEINNRMEVFLEKSRIVNGRPSAEIVAAQNTGIKPGKKIYLKVSGEMPSLHFFYSTNGRSWNPLVSDQDATFLSTATAGGFVGTYIGMYAVQESGDQSPENGPRKPES